MQEFQSLFWTKEIVPLKERKAVTTLGVYVHLYVYALVLRELREQIVSRSCLPGRHTHGAAVDPACVLRPATFDSAWSRYPSSLQYVSGDGKDPLYEVALPCGVCR